MTQPINIAALSGQFETFLTQLAAFAAIALPNILIALVLLIAGVWLAGRAGRAVGRLIERQQRIDSTLIGVFSGLIRYGILTIVIVAVLGQLGVQTTSIIAAIGAAGLAIGLALQGTLQNVAAGIMLIWLRPFRVGEYIDNGIVAGTVKEIGLFASELHTWDGVFQFVPNAQLWNTRITNYARLPTRLVDLKFGVGYDDDLEKGQDVLRSLARADERVHAEPAPETFVDELADSAIVLRLRAWTDTPSYWNVRRALTERGKVALEAAGLSIPFPQRDVHLHSRNKPDAKAA